jgi:quercetin dioxygenase-like cupin family protein
VRDLIRALMCVAVVGSSSLATAPPIAPTVLLRTPLSGDEAREVLVVSAELAEGGAIPRHTHPGDEYATLLEGALELLQEGQPARRIAPGESYHNPRGLVHETRNVGEGPARILSTFIVTRGEALIQPVR